MTGSNNGDGYDYKPECRYFEVNVHGQFGGIVYYNENDNIGDVGKIEC
ncbi:DUF2824 family protein [Salmonella enterica subsp. enterica serovar Anatum]|nr:DUF2824 family protein [Salmonella enterica subsp. enterica serovar Anatum]